MKLDHPNLNYSLTWFPKIYSFILNYIIFLYFILCLPNAIFFLFCPFITAIYVPYSNLPLVYVYEKEENEKDTRCTNETLSKDESGSTNDIKD